jgi:hypothetical protein
VLKKAHLCAGIENNSEKFRHEQSQDIPSFSSLTSISARFNLYFKADEETDLFFKSGWCVLA